MVTLRMFFMYFLATLIFVSLGWIKILSASDNLERLLAVLAASFIAWLVCILGTRAITVLTASISMMVNGGTVLFLILFSLFTGYAVSLVVNYLLYNSVRMPSHPWDQLGEMLMIGTAYAAITILGSKNAIERSTSKHSS